MPPPIDSQGTLLYRGDVGAATNFTVVPKITNVDPVALERALRQITDLSHTDTHKHKHGLADMPEISCEGWYQPDDAEHKGIFSDLTNGIERYYKLEIPTSPVTVLTFTALVVNPRATPGGVDADWVLTFNLKPQSLISGLHD